MDSVVLEVGEVAGVIASPVIVGPQVRKSNDHARRAAAQG